MLEIVQMLYMLVFAHIKGAHFAHEKGVSLEFGDFGIVELFLLNLKWLLKQRCHLVIFT